MKREVEIFVNEKGNIDVTSAVRLKDIVGTLPVNRRYILTINEEAESSDIERMRRHFFAGVDQVCQATGNKKEDVEKEVKRVIIRDMLSEEKAESYINDLINEEQDFSFRWLSAKGWQVLLNRFKWWAYNTCDCYI